MCKINSSSSLLRWFLRNNSEWIIMKCQWQMLSIGLHWWDHISNVQVLLQRSGLSTISDILRHRRTSLFGHVARLDPRVPANTALHLMVKIVKPRRQEAIARLDSTSGPSSSHLDQPYSGACQSYSAVNSIENWDCHHRAAQRSVRTIRDDDDDYDNNNSYSLQPKESQRRYH